MKDSVRIVVTGMGVVSPLGSDLETFHESLRAGKSGITQFESRHDLGYRRNQAGVVPDEDLASVLGTPPEGFGRTSCFALAASRMALQFGELPNNCRCGLVLGTAMGEALEWEQLWEQENPGGNEADPCRSPRIPHPLPLSRKVAFELGLEGPAYLVASTCASGNHTIDWACEELRDERADAMLAVGVDTLSYVDMLGFNRLYLQDPQACRPFDLDRKGTILGEGAGALLLERLDHALRRRAVPLAEVAGSGLSCDADSSFKCRAHDVEVPLAAAHAAFREAGLHPTATDYVSAHGTGTRLNDERETNVLKSLLDSRAYRIPVSAIKSMLGHTQAAASSLEAIAAILSMQHEVLYPTINYQTPDPKCDLDYVPNVARAQRVNVVLSSAFGFGGNNSVVLLTRWASC